MEELRIELPRFRRIRRSLEASLATGTRKASVVFFSVLVFLLLAFTTDIPWHLQTLQEGVQYWDNALHNAVMSIYLGGAFSLGLTVFYSITSGFALTSVLVHLRNLKLSGKGLGSILPGFVATGCASCGVGFASFVGLTSVAAALPFQGDLFKLGGIALLLYALHDMGDPEICELNAG